MESHTPNTRAVGVVVGSVTLATFDAWERGGRFKVVKAERKDEVVYAPLAALFFGTTKDFARAFAPGADPSSCVVDMARSTVADYSACVTLAEVAERYAQADKAFKIVNLTEEDAALLRGARILRANLRLQLLLEGHQVALQLFLVLLGRVPHLLLDLGHGRRVRLLHRELLLAEGLTGVDLLLALSLIHI